MTIFHSRDLVPEEVEVDRWTSLSGSSLPPTWSAPSSAGAALLLGEHTFFTCCCHAVLYFVWKITWTLWQGNHTAVTCPGRCAQVVPLVFQFITFNLAEFSNHCFHKKQFAWRFLVNLYLTLCKFGRFIVFIVFFNSPLLYDMMS